MKELSDDFISKVLKNWAAHYPTPASTRKRLLSAAEYLPFNFPFFPSAVASINSVLPHDFSHVIFNWESPPLQLELTWKRHIVC